MLPYVLIMPLFFGGAASKRPRARLHRANKLAVEKRRIGSCVANSNTSSFLPSPPATPRTPSQDAFWSRPLQDQPVPEADAEAFELGIDMYGSNGPAAEASTLNDVDPILKNKVRWIMGFSLSLFRKYLPVLFRFALPPEDRRQESEIGGIQNRPY
ncbi:hypothetical protein PAPYR_9708 [Paratrimastix pyriformis]|uniref:Uncharacterized protein n=1 Tax=Paratrimastix pyriformis TaxID=342808 RepID=A0ABQ8UEV9_9EUKA|nr:hypothetical protein PAPYR_9708 [Paratrimastix pyriformis]